MTKIAPDQILTTDMTTGLITGVQTGLANIEDEDWASGTLRPDHLDHTTTSNVRSYYNQSNPGVSANYANSSGTYAPLNHGGMSTLVTINESFEQEWIILRSRLTLEIETGLNDTSGVGAVDTCFLRPKVDGTNIGGLQYPWLGVSTGLGFGISQHNAGQTPSQGAADSAIAAFSGIVLNKHRTLTFNLWYPVRNSGSPVTTGTITDVYWELRVDADQVTIGRMSLDISLEAT